MSRARDKGTKFETAVLPWVKVLFPGAERTGSAAFAEGDYTACAPFFLEAKNRKDMKLGAWVKAAHLGAEREGRQFPVVLHKRRMFGPSGAYVTQTVETWVRSMLWALQQDPDDWAHIHELPDPLNPSFDPFEEDEG